jgi:hypothetical protein
MSAREVTIEHEPAAAEVPPGGMSQKRPRTRKGGRKVLHDPMPDVQVVPRVLADEGEGEGVGGRKGRPKKVSGVQEENQDHLHVRVSPLDWEGMSIAEGQQAIIELMGILEDGRRILRRREADEQQRNLVCSSPSCMKPLKSARAAVSSWTSRDGPTGLERTYYACSQKCHMIIHRFQAGERAIKT